MAAQAALTRAAEPDGLVDARQQVEVVVTRFETGRVDRNGLTEPRGAERDVIALRFALGL